MGMGGGGGEGMVGGGGMGGGGGGGGEGHFGFHSPPAFIDDLTIAQLRELMELRFNRTLTKGQMANASLAIVSAAAPANTAQTVADFTAWQNNITAHGNAVVANITANPNISANAKALATQIQGIVNDQSLTVLQTCENVFSLILAVNKSVLEELRPHRTDMRHHGNHSDGGNHSEGMHMEEMHGGGGEHNSEHAAGVTPMPIANMSAMICEHGGPFGGDGGFQHHKMGGGGGGGMGMDGGSGMGGGGDKMAMGGGGGGSGMDGMDDHHEEGHAEEGRKVDWNGVMGQHNRRR
jgi:hypothetical protein